jgi:hypothetical protein
MLNFLSESGILINISINGWVEGEVLYKTHTLRYQQYQASLIFLKQK